MNLCMPCSVSDEKFASAAAIEALKSSMTQKHGCVAVSNGKIRGRGHNSCRTQSCDGFIQNTCSCHAEIAALRNMWHTNCGTQHSKFSRTLKGQYVQQAF